MATGLLLLWASSAPSVGADSQQERRNRSGQRLFRALLTADRAIAERTGPDGRLGVAFFYELDAEQATEQLNGFARRGEDDEPEPIRGLPLALAISSDPSFAAWGEHPPAGIFITEAPDDETLAALVRYGIENHVVVYSPFEGHVERGVLGGLSVEAQVRPYLNAATLEASGIPLKQLFLEVAKIYR